MIFHCRSFKKYLTKFYDRRHEWAVAHLSDLPIRGNDTHFREAMRVVKSEILDQAKPFDAVNLSEFILTRFQDYYQRRILDLANGHLENIISGMHSRNFSKNDITQVKAQ